jgi:signal transduction histidine kinase
MSRRWAALNGPALLGLTLGAAVLFEWLTRGWVDSDPSNSRYWEFRLYWFAAYSVATVICAYRSPWLGLTCSLTWYLILRFTWRYWDFHWSDLAQDPQRLLAQIALPLLIGWPAQRAREADRLRRAQLSQLVLGLAHRFNNLLIVILGNASLLRFDTFDLERQGKVTAIVKAAEEAAALVRELRVYARNGSVAPSIREASAVIEAIDKDGHDSVC